MTPTEQPIFTPAEIEKMRMFVINADKQSTGGVFDLNNPPRKPYIHQDWPRLMYNADPAGMPKHIRALDAADLENKLEEGWLMAPAGEEAPELIELDPADAAEVAAIDKKIADAKAKKAADARAARAARAKKAK
jgi:hypothetical protein